jgi:hypothetical protein
VPVPWPGVDYHEIEPDGPELARHRLGGQVTRVDQDRPVGLAVQGGHLV